MKNQLNQLMTSLGASNSLSKINCEKCGKERKQIQVDHPFEDRKVWVPVACECVIKALDDVSKNEASRYKQNKINRALKLSSSYKELRELTFDNYKHRPGNETAYKEVVDAVNNFGHRNKLGVFIFGETGNGKSHLTAAGGNRLIELGFSVVFMTEKDLLSRFNATKNFNNEESFHEIMTACVTADLLIWDDFMSSQKLSNEEKDWMFQIVNGRERANKPIWATSNLTVQEFKDERTAFKLDDKGRTWWRLIGNMNCVFNKSSNYRQVKAMARVTGVTADEYDMS
ncbi:ATP-binding protein [Bacillaceae bacterium IKA-2]|nr:ATP-binding protein [Bacillaceae bacterium IKA-2]